MMLRALILTISLLPGLAAAAAPRTFAELAYYIVDLMNYAVGTIIVLGLVAYFWGTVQRIIKLKGGAKSDEMSKFFVTGIIVLFVMVSIWGILQLLEATIFSGPGSVGSSGSNDPCLEFDDCDFE